MQLVCPAGSLPALKSALRQGADAIYVGSATTPTPAISPASTLTNASCRKACGESTRPGGSST